MAFEWDSNKAVIHVRRHGVRFEEAVGVFSDDYAITIIDDESDPDEQRFVTLGRDIKGRLVVVVYTHRGENIRIISARRAEKHEQAEYEAEE